MMTHTEAPISINLKTLAGTQLTLRAGNAEEFTMLTSTIFQITEAITEVETAVRGANVAVPQDPQVGYATAALGGIVIQPTQSAPSAGVRMCPHGTMTRIHGLTGKFGPYKGHFCPAKQGDPSKCNTQYIKQTMPEWNVFVADQTKQ